MNLWFVIPAWRRYAVSKLAFAQQARLHGELAARGITAQTVVVADDENLDIAAEHGFHTIEQRNLLGLKVNDGFEYACANGADWVAFIGSDDWLHVDATEPLVELGQRCQPPLVAGHKVAIVNLECGVLRRLGARGPEGVSPWFVPRWMLELSAFRPARDEATRGLEGSISLGLPLGADRLFHDPHDLCRVDFKTTANMTPFDRISRLLGYGSEDDAFDVLATRFDADLVELAAQTYLDLQPVAA